MARSKAKAMPTFKSTTELVDFFDTHDLGDYWESLPEAKLDIDIRKRRHLVAIDEKLMLAARNLPHVEVLPAAALNPLALVSYDKVLMTVAAVKMIEERLQ